MFCSICFISEIGKTSFHFVSANYFCKTNEGKYIPSEISLIKFDFENGITKMFHEFLNPSELEGSFLAFDLSKSIVSFRVSSNWLRL